MKDYILRYLESAGEVFGNPVDRRRFLKWLGRWSGGLILGGYIATAASCARKEGTQPVPESSGAVSRKRPPGEGPADLVIASGTDTPMMVKDAIGGLGGMDRFVKPGDMVVLKPNSSFACGPEMATNTDPEVVGEVTRLCRESGASKIIVIDHTLADVPDICFSRSGIKDAAEAEGAEIIAYPSGDRGHGTEVTIEEGEVLKRAGIYPQVLAADVVINLPKAKDHSGATLTLSMKNLIGLTADMGKFHEIDLHQAIADINTAIRPQLIVMDATRILLTGGPGGPGDIRDTRQVIAGTDPVAIDSYAATLFGLTGEDVGYIVNGARMGRGTMDYGSLRLEEVSVGG